MAPTSTRAGCCGDTDWQFEGQEIFKKAVTGMGVACEDVLARGGLAPGDIDLVVPHQANLRIIEFVAKRAGVPMERVYVNVQRYGNMSAATVPVALCEALEEGRVQPGATLLMPAFGAGLTFCAHLVRWGERTTPLGQSDAELPPCDRSGLQIVQRIMAAKKKEGRSAHDTRGSQRSRAGGSCRSSRWRCSSTPWASASCCRWRRSW